MKRITIALGINLLCLACLGQENQIRTNINKVILEGDTIAQALVNMAMVNPQIRQAENIATSSEYAYRKSKTMWLNNITAIGNLNEYSLKQTNTNTDPLKQSTQYPRYNFGVVVPLGIFINNPKQTKSDYYQYKAAESQVEIQKNEIRTQVLILYQDYLMNVRYKNLQTEVTNDYHVIYIKNEEKFKNGQMSLDAFTSASVGYNNALTKQIQIDRELAVSKVKLEALIGMNLNQALMQIGSSSSNQRK